MAEHPTSPPWGPAVKILVSIVGLVIIGALLVRFASIIPLLVAAGILTFLVAPLVRFLSERTPLTWAMATNLSFLELLILVIGASTATSLAAVQQLQALVNTIQGILFTLPELLAELGAQRYVIGPWVFDLSGFDLALLGDQALRSVQPLLGEVSGLLRSLATVAIESIARVIFVLAVSYFLTLDFKRLGQMWHSIRVPGYEADLTRLRAALGRIWNAFLRGQLLIVLITGLLTGVLMTGLNVRFSIGLGIMGGVAKFIPIIGPFSAGLIAAMVALFQPENWLGLSPLAHAGVVVLSVIVLDQSIDYLLLPRVMGASLNLHPIVILVGAIIGASLAGVIGLLLSAPAMATILLLTRYTFRKLVDLPPWDPPIDAPVASGRARSLSLAERWRQFWID
ncbi:MAG: AI-2E family transporter [Anaerolineales bacterium]